ncbi:MULTISPECIES: HAD family phosphatase [Rhodopseudomonas]|uniref:HAD family hydrolase n=1 Tax=Rhodopseudomonas palustris TaxID=1076 RepID=A0A0D7E0M9_RHOPL|nr:MULTISPECIES: HAD family phosphatase [Rhodopseudomonas]KIZ34035.1 HAD family hydrolase [Rhodopseudomonas palustris]MDF3809858.1 HAD family phosphatase [Rhodopseudomonas sp. BAL398]WOK15532.1 HAD family phosphatase [Rhodopseudomonas sp. BAL398]
MSGDWQVDAVLLDMDGTLIDTERIYISSLTNVLTGFGYADAETVCHAMVGLTGPDCQQLLIARYGADVPLDAINRAFVARRDDVLRDGLPLKPGARELLDALREADCPMALVTSASRRTAEQHLTLAGIRARFATLLTRDDVAHGKPDPALYLLAARTMRARPQACVAVEDSSVGVAAAHGAGVITLMVPDLEQPGAETRAQCAAVLPDLHQVLATLRARGGLRAARPS